MEQDDNHFPAIELTSEDEKILADLLENPRGPNEKLQQSYAAYRQRKAPKQIADELNGTQRLGDLGSTGA